MAIFESTKAAVLFLYSTVNILLNSQCMQLNGTKVLGMYSVVNKIQCQRLCWYHLSCSASSFHDSGSGGNNNKNCLLHADRLEDISLRNDGWVVEKAGKGTTSHACASRPCAKTHMCVPVGSSPDPYHCLLLPVDCGAPEPSVNHTLIQRSGSREGDVAAVSCDPDYVPLPRDAVMPFLVCDENGQWVAQSSVADFACLQVQFHDVAVPFSEPLPWNISDGWEACVIGNFRSKYYGVDISFVESKVSSVHSAHDVEFYLNIGGRRRVSWNQKSAGRWPSGVHRILSAVSPIAYGDPFRVSFRLLPESVLSINVNDVETYALNLTGTVDLSVVRYMAMFNRNVIQFVSLTSAAACH